MRFFLVLCLLITALPAFAGPDRAIRPGSRIRVWTGGTATTGILERIQEDRLHLRNGNHWALESIDTMEVPIGRDRKTAIGGWTGFVAGLGLGILAGRAAHDPHSARIGPSGGTIFAFFATWASSTVAGIMIGNSIEVDRWAPGYLDLPESSAFHVENASPILSFQICF